jgi:hypothetical protein
MGMKHISSSVLLVLEGWERWGREMARVIDEGF